jgi:hypothetical protein
MKHHSAPTLDPRTEFAAVLREIGGVVEGDHPVMNGKPQRIPAVDDKRSHDLLYRARRRCAERIRAKQSDQTSHPLEGYGAIFDFGS